MYPQIRSRSVLGDAYTEREKMREQELNSVWFLIYIACICTCVVLTIHDFLI